MGKTVKYIFGLLKVVFIAALMQSAIAQEATKNTNQNETKVDISSEKLEQLIQTLESESARQDFIDNLKTLTEIGESEEESELPSVADFLDLDKTSDSIGNQYIGALDSIGEKMGLSGTVVGNIVFVIVAIFIVILFVGLNKWLANFLDRKLNKVRSQFNLSSSRFKLYFKIQVWFGYILGLTLFTYALSEIFNFTFSGGEQSFSEIALRYIFTLFVLVILFVSIWELVNAGIELATNNLDGFENRRMETLLPIIRNLFLCVLAVLSALMILSEFGIDIMPLLAGAGVLGIAIGFGAQTLVKDFLTGFIIIFEDLLQVGDVVKIGDRLGSVEVITIRKVQLRDLDGTVHTIPFSEVSIVDNLTKEFSYYLFEVGVAYREDTDEVVECLKAIGDELEASDEYTNLILAPLEILGVDHFADSAVIIKARIKTRSHDKWKVGREFNRRMKHAFDEQKIEMPFPHQTIYFGEDKEGNAPKAPIKLFEELQNKSSESVGSKHKKQREKREQEEQQEQRDQRKPSSKKTPVPENKGDQQPETDNKSIEDNESTGESDED